MASIDLIGLYFFKRVSGRLFSYGIENKRKLQKMELWFEWHDAKNEANYNKHRVSFEEAALIFEGEVFSAIDRGQDYGEVRSITIGFVDDDCYVVVHTERNGVIRIMSARKGGRRDRRKYHTSLAGGASGPEEPG